MLHEKESKKCSRRTLSSAALTTRFPGSHRLHTDFMINWEISSWPGIRDSWSWADFGEPVQVPACFCHNSRALCSKGPVLGPISHFRACEGASGSGLRGLSPPWDDPAEFQASLGHRAISGPRLRVHVWSSRSALWTFLTCQGFTLQPSREGTDPLSSKKANNSWECGSQSLPGRTLQPPPGGENPKGASWDTLNWLLFPFFPKK